MVWAALVIAYCVAIEDGPAFTCNVVNVEVALCDNAQRAMRNWKKENPGATVIRIRCNTGFIS
jgi:hypothetical protein